ncbi:MAG: DUF6456 domain-containing protein [Caulobacter sp.]|nr:DUF6456 domain-containing protein [Caulobacter sp.]
MTGPDQRAGRAARALSRPDAWLEAAGPDLYRVRLSADRRRRSLLTLDAATFAALAREPGLRTRPEGGWRLARPVPRQAPPSPGRPSLIEGRRSMMGPDGRTSEKTVNLGESPIAWLARRRDGQGRPWLTLVEVAAAEKLRDDFVIAGTLGRLTMTWDAGPRSSSGRGPGSDPAERARAAKDRIARALTDVGPGLREVLEHVCLAGTALEAAERALGLPRRAGKTVLKLALGRLAAHYGLAV